MNHRAPLKLRLFVAVELEDATRSFASGVEQRLAEAGVAGRFEAPEKLHVTVAFLGSVPEAKLPIVAQALREACAACRPFELGFERVGAFPKGGHPRIVWIGPAIESQAFADCAKRVRDAYERIGFTFDHDAMAHITLCRPTSVPAGALGALPSGVTQTVAGLTLVRSLPAGPTTRYEALERTPFG